jgi:hypothetical protein
MLHRLRRRLPATLCLAALCLAGPLALTGCSGARGPGYGEVTATPIFSTKERFSRIARNIDMEFKMLNEDLDRVLMLRPVSDLTEYNLP